MNPTMIWLFIIGEKKLGGKDLQRMNGSKSVAFAVINMDCSHYEISNNVFTNYFGVFREPFFIEFYCKLLKGSTKIRIYCQVKSTQNDVWFNLGFGGIFFLWAHLYYKIC